MKLSDIQGCEIDGCLELELQHAVHVEPHHGAVATLLRREALVAAPQHVAHLACVTFVVFVFVLRLLFTRMNPREPAATARRQNLGSGY